MGNLFELNLLNLEKCYYNEQSSSFSTTTGKLSWKLWKSECK